MAEKNSFPQIPATVWWGVRAVLQRTPTATVDETYLSVQLNVQTVAARQYVAELRRVGLLDENCKATELAKKWRVDETYSDAVEEMLANVYPQSLRDVAPPESANREKAISWFLRQGLGQGSAKNRAATYLLISSKEPGETGKQASTNIARPAKVDGPRQKSSVSSPQRHSKEKSKPERETSIAQYPLHLNMQIHIGADASPEQIETIFRAMKKYLSNDGSD